MTTKEVLLTAYQYAVLDAIDKLSAMPAVECYGVTIRKIVSKRTGFNYSYGQLYSTLDALEELGFIQSFTVAGGENRGGMPKKLCLITDRGRRFNSDITL